MPTQNRRVATYLPPHIDDPFKDFKSKRDIKGDSEALIAILSEYFQVSQEIAYSSSSNLLQRIEAIEERLSSLKSELISELKNGLQVSQAKTDKKKGSSQGELQRELLIPESQAAENSNDSKSSLVSSEVSLCCPDCGSANLGKNGHTEKGLQRYRCKDCKRRFVSKQNAHQ